MARTGARWIAAGFVHGVLNTDNINITGESFDYGPWRFLPTYDPAFTAAYFDETGLYAFGRQPDALAWNLTRLAECLLPLGEHAALKPALNTFWPAFQREIGPRDARPARRWSRSATRRTRELVTALFAFLHDSQAPYEQFFFDWRGGVLSAERAAREPLGRALCVRRVRPAPRGARSAPAGRRRQPRPSLFRPRKRRAPC